jgi:hypothetical protein
MGVRSTKIPTSTADSTTQGAQLAPLPGRYQNATVQIGKDSRLETVESGAVIDSLVNLSDVSADNPANGDALIYNNSSGKWEPAPVSGGSSGGLTHPQVMARVSLRI